MIRGWIMTQIRRGHQFADALSIQNNGLFAENRAPMTRINKTFVLAVLLLFVALGSSGCVYRLTVQQGNLVDQAKVDQIEVGMTRNQVRFLLGTPLVDDAFNRNRWDYLYYVQPGRKPAVERHWITVYFDDNVVTDLKRGIVDDAESQIDLPETPTSTG